MSLEKKIQEEKDLDEKPNKIKQYIKGCLDSDNSRLYGTFQQRAALNITQFPKIQGSMLIRMGIVYPIVSYLIQEAGLPTDAASDFGINYHTWVAGYASYFLEIQLGLSKHAIETAGKAVSYVKNLVKSKTPP
ncbi:MAG: hypothetical protein KJ583_04540 [Nanoarchaeota archaeon]|nr:hypothetical protein [Nanoarchaeota archaeon]MBU1270024.1 hypothetical protein [Nanoarchaeota archaeon]MBU1604560.1 hypothetical protein [Nanoarchaeota archaeon]MBU2443628.1 hypothetical protein [Nanoarchaeota archaeon]